MGLALTLRDVRVLGDDGGAILSVPALDVAAGSLVGVRGPSGAGKSTFLTVLAGLVEPDAGEVRWGAQDLAGLNSEGRAAFRRASIGLVFQDFLLFEELDAATNAAIAASFVPKASRKGLRARAEARLERLGVPGGARAITSFSGGERQRVAVARALAHGPQVLLADEPTAALDRVTADALIADFTALAREDGLTVIIASHDAQLLAQMDRVISLADGALDA
ncbi:MAG: ABC transporter ATP-binding protein [Pseudomonadota bacterium]